MTVDGCPGPCLDRPRTGEQYGPAMDFGFSLPGRGPLATPDVLVKLARSENVEDVVGVDLVVQVRVARSGVGNRRAGGGVHHVTDVTRAARSGGRRTGDAGRPVPCPAVAAGDDLGAEGSATDGSEGS